MGWRAVRVDTEQPRVQRILVVDGDRPLTWAEVAVAWQQPAFAEVFAETLVASGFGGFFWECAPVSDDLWSAPFECVVVRNEHFASLNPEPGPFRDHFGGGGRIVTFPNLSGDATLVVPRPFGHDEACTHMAAFLRQAPVARVTELFGAVGRALLDRVDGQPVWVSTSGLGVHWLHVRISDVPKYYTYGAYRSAPGAD